MAWMTRWFFGPSSKVGCTEKGPAINFSHVDVRGVILRYQYDPGSGLTNRRSAAMGNTVYACDALNRLTNTGRFIQVGKIQTSSPDIL